MYSIYSTPRHVEVVDTSDGIAAIHEWEAQGGGSRTPRGGVGVVVAGGNEEDEKGHSCGGGPWGLRPRGGHPRAPPWDHGSKKSEKCAGALFRAFFEG